MLTRRGFLGGLGVLALEGCGVYSPGFKFFDGDKSDFVFSRGFLQNIRQLEDYSDFVMERDYGSFVWSYNERNLISEVVQDLRDRILENRIEKPILFGASFGGMVSLKYAERFPDDYSGIVLLSSGNKVRKDNPFGKGELFFGSVRNLLEDAFNFNLEAEMIQKPLMSFHGSQDEFFDIADVDFFLSSLKRVRRVVFEGAKHDILQSRKSEILNYLGENLDFFN